jgi:hypothetical protein
MKKLKKLWKKMKESPDLNQPTERRTTTMRDLCTPEQLEEITRLLKIEPTLERSRKIREYLITQRDDLEAKGVLPEYLAYFIEYAQIKAMEEFAETERQNCAKN